MTSPTRHLVTGAGGFIGARLADFLADRGEVIGVDRRAPEDWGPCREAVQRVQSDHGDIAPMAARLEGVDRLWILGAESGGVRFQHASSTTRHDHADEIDRLLTIAREAGVPRVLFASSAAVSALERGSPNGYAVGKQRAEQVIRRHREDHGLDARIARLHHVYGPGRALGDDREGVLMALCRRVALAAHRRAASVEIHGDGTERRSFLHVDDAVRGLDVLMEHDSASAAELGPDRAHSIGELLSLIQEIGGADLEVVSRPALAPPQPDQVIDPEVTYERIGWRAAVELRAGLASTYAWVRDQVERRGVE